MPYRAPHLCNWVGCNKSTQSRFCEEHQKLYWEKDNENRKNDHHYVSSWARLSKMILSEEPLCRMCKAEGITRLARCVDHIDGDSMNNDRDNLQPLCWSHHSSKTVLENGGFGKSREVSCASR